MAQRHECGEQTFATPKIDICIHLFSATHIFTKEDFGKTNGIKYAAIGNLGNKLKTKYIIYGHLVGTWKNHVEHIQEDKIEKKNPYLSPPKRKNLGVLSACCFISLAGKDFYSLLYQSLLLAQANGRDMNCGTIGIEPQIISCNTTQFWKRYCQGKITHYQTHTYHRTFFNIFLIPWSN